MPDDSTASVVYFFIIHSVVICVSGLGILPLLGVRLLLRPPVSKGAAGAPAKPRPGNALGNVLENVEMFTLTKPL